MLLDTIHSLRVLLFCSEIFFLRLYKILDSLNDNKYTLSNSIPIAHKNFIVLHLIFHEHTKLDFSKQKQVFNC